MKKKIIALVTCLTLVVGASSSAFAFAAPGCEHCKAIYGYAIPMSFDNHFTNKYKCRSCSSKEFDSYTCRYCNDLCGAVICANGHVTSAKG